MARQRPHMAILRRQSDRVLWKPDAVHSINVPREWRSTDHPIQRGVPVTDHVQRQPNRVTLNVTLTPTPLASSGETGGWGRVQERLAFLVESADAGEVFDVVTRRFGVLRSYLIQSVTTLTNEVESLTFPIVLKQTKFATATAVEITVDVVNDEVAVGAPDEVDAGEQPTTSTDEDPAAEESDQSILAGLLDLF